MTSRERHLLSVLAALLDDLHDRFPEYAEREEFQACIALAEMGMAEEALLLREILKESRDETKNNNRHPKKG